MSRKEDILNAATDLFARQGFNGTATSQIARRAGVAHGTVFHHFKSKENLLIAICEDLVQDYVRGIRASAEETGTGWERLEKVLKFSQDFRDRHLQSIIVASRETRFLERGNIGLTGHFRGLMDQVIDAKKQCILRGQEDGTIRDVPPHETALIIHLLLNGFIQEMAQGIISLPELSGEVREFCRRSVAAAPENGEEVK
jgi:AcrR family transcriptional regulator